MSRLHCCKATCSDRCCAEEHCFLVAEAEEPWADDADLPLEHQIVPLGDGVLVSCVSYVPVGDGVLVSNCLTPILNRPVAIELREYCEL